MSVHLLEGPVLVTEVTALAIGAEALAVELPAVLRLILVVCVALLLLTEVQVVVLAELIDSVRVLALVAVATEAGLSPVLAKLALVH